MTIGRRRRPRVIATLNATALDGGCRHLQSVCSGIHYLRNALEKVGEEVLGHCALEGTVEGLGVVAAAAITFYRGSYRLAKDDIPRVAPKTKLG